MNRTELFAGDTPIYDEIRITEGQYVQLLGERYYQIRHYDRMPPFFMSLVSSADHWLFIASTGGLTAGRVNANSALFPYETEDKITAHSDLTGSKTIIRAKRGGKTYLWEPFSRRYAGIYNCERNLYKNTYSNKLLFEEVNHDLGLTLRTAWFTGDRFGFIRACWLLNQGDSTCQVELLDGLQNILPYGATAQLQTNMSSLLNAYKRNELVPKTGLAIYALSATLTDRAEPSESLKATAAWQVGLADAAYLLSSAQLDAFRSGQAIKPELDIRGKAGAYFVNAALELPPNQGHHWRIVADVNQDSAAIVRLNQLLGLEDAALIEAIDDDIDRATAGLVRYVAAADGLQLTSREMISTHHFANVLFNVMRGGIFAAGYQIDRTDFLDFVKVRNRPLLAKHAEWFAALPGRLSMQDLEARAEDSGDPDLIRLGYEYLPLSFSRRHGDPSRPWNIFSINVKHADGSPRLDYQGNWRDIFQNWEPLAYSFPEFVESMVAKFLNATTLDGYNPYRVTRDGIEWEVPEPENPWSNIGYWSDHQIIYLQKLLEIVEQLRPGHLEKLWNQAIFAYANVPYRLRAYPDMLADWNDTIDFDWDSEGAIERAVHQMGTDARLLRDADGQVVHVTMTEKLLVLLLAKVTNLVPDGGIWMNTQRPEWNDANNALAGKGLSVVTTAYLRRFIAFWQAQLAAANAGAADSGAFTVNKAVADLLHQVHVIFQEHRDHLAAGFGDRERRAIMDALGTAATAYRTVMYDGDRPVVQAQLTAQQIAGFLALAQEYIEHTLEANRRPDGLTHSYNTLHIRGQEASIEHLYLMLEGQVALLSAGFLAPEEALRLLQAMRHSELYRADLHTYMLYPNRALPGFFEKNNVPASEVAGSQLVAALTAAGDRRVLIRDEEGAYHFNGGFRNAADLARALDQVAEDPAYAELVAAERATLLDLFEATFDHRAFTGRSGTFYAYEGLGSVYWHMVSKLLLAAQESYLQAIERGADPAVISALADAYYDIRLGLGFNKSPAEYGAFPADPYSHSPMGGGARQPGMTGQVKEEVLTRFGELGVSVQHGALTFNPTLLKEDEFLPAAGQFAYVDVQGNRRAIPVPAGALAFTFCQTPVVYLRGADPQIQVIYSDGRTETVPGRRLDAATSQHIFDRGGQIERLQVTVKK